SGAARHPGDPGHVARVADGSRARSRGRGARLHGQGRVRSGRAARSDRAAGGIVPTRVLVVEDSITVRKRLCQVIADDPDLTLVAEVGDGVQAIEACRDLRPDVIAMDMVMPGVDGLAATEYIMAHHPTPILIVSASLNRGELFRTYDALAAGAVDV